MNRFASPSFPRYVDEREAARILGFSVQSLRNWRSAGKPPPYIKRNRSVRYFIPDIIAWMEAGRVNREAAG